MRSALILVSLWFLGVWFTDAQLLAGLDALGEMLVVVLLFK